MDVACCQQDHPTQFSDQPFANNQWGVKGLLKWLNQRKIASQDSLFCREHTGHYTWALCCFLQDKHWAYTLVSGLDLNKSLGITPGNNEGIDAQGSRRFACLHQQGLKPMQLPSSTFLKPKNGMACPDRLTKTTMRLKQTIQEWKDTAALVEHTFIIKASEKQLNRVERQMDHTDPPLQAALEEDEELQNHFRLVNSLVGVGFQYRFFDLHPGLYRF